MRWCRCAVQLLFLVLVLGVAGMHTVGHHSGHASHSSTMAMPAQAAKSAHETTIAAPAPPGDADATPMCLAILAAGTAVSLVLVSLRPRRALIVGHHQRRWGRGVAAGPRAGPDGVRLSLRLAEITVLRI